MVTWEQVVEAVGAALGGDRAGGRRRLRECWDAAQEAQHAHRCVLAHYLADLEPELADEVAWDERALEEFAEVGEQDLAAVGIPSAAGMAPSLHLNLADGYRRQGRVQDARHHLAAGERAAGALPDDGYGAMLRTGLERLRRRLDGELLPEDGEDLPG